jgi:hypothetical protein
MWHKLCDTWNAWNIMIMIINTMCKKVCKINIQEYSGLFTMAGVFTMAGGDSEQQLWHSF